MDYVKEVFSQDFIKDVLYASGGGIVGAVTGGVVQRLAGKTDADLTGRLVKILGSVGGGALTAYFINRFTGDTRGAKWALFGSVFPPIYEWITEKINPEQYAEKIAQSMGITWYSGASQAYQPVVVSVTPATPVAETTAPAEEEAVKFVF
jgi:hypothetical protein